MSEKNPHNFSSSAVYIYFLIKEWKPEEPQTDELTKPNCHEAMASIRKQGIQQVCHYKRLLHFSVTLNHTPEQMAPAKHITGYIKESNKLVHEKKLHSTSPAPTNSNINFQLAKQYIS